MFRSALQRVRLSAIALLALLGTVALTGGCDKPDDNAGGGGGAGGGAGKRKIVIGMVAKSQSNDVFQAAYVGAKDGAAELAAKYDVEVTIDWRTPADEDAAKQVEQIEALVRADVDAIMVSCSNAEVLTPAINRAAEKNIPVLCFDSDAPASKRFAYYGTDDEPCGAAIMAELAKSMNGKGTVAILGGSHGAPNLAKRIEGARKELAKHPEMKLLVAGGGVFYHKETADEAATAVQNATRNNPEIQGWCMIGGWPLFTKNALNWEPGKIKVASCDALPQQLDYLRSGHVEVLMAQDCYGWGYKSVEIVLEKVVNDKDPASPRVIDPLKRVTKENVDEFAKQWEKWLKK